MTVAAFLVAAGVGASPASAQVFTKQPPKADNIRGPIVEANAAGIVVAAAGGRTGVVVGNNVPVFGLREANYAEVRFGDYVGAVSVKLDKYSPIVRDSLSYLHKGFELRIMDEALRGLALGHTHWDLRPGTVISHGWVDDQEVRVISIKYGPTEEEETDVEVPRDVLVTRMALGSRSLLKPGNHVFVGATKSNSGNYFASFVIVGEGGLKPQL